MKLAAALWVASAIAAPLIAPFYPAQAAPKNDNRCAATEYSWPSDQALGTGWFDFYQQKPCAGMQEAPPNNDTSSDAMQEAAPSNDTSPAEMQAAEMVPAKASTIQAIDASKLKQGDQIKATLTDKVQLKNGPELPGGTELVGHVTVDRMENDGTYRLALVFTNADLKDGKVIPIKATIVRFYQPSSYYPLPINTSYYASPITNNWTDQTLQVDQHDALEGVDLHSSIDGSSSGSFVSHKKDEIKVLPGTVLGLAIAVQKGS